MARNKHIGSKFDDFLDKEGLLVEANAVAIKRVIAWQIAQAMKKGHITKTQLAQEMETSRAAVDRLLDKSNSSLTLETLTGAAKALGCKVRVELIAAA